MNTKMTLGLSIIAIAAGAFFYQQSNSGAQSGAQSGPHGQSSGPPDAAPLAQGDPIVTITLPDILSSRAQIGKRGFDAKCAQCHGENAVGQNGVAPPLVHKIYEPGHHSDMAFVLAAKNGVRSHHWRFGDMPPVTGLTDGDVKSIARYIRELQQENGIF